MTKFIFFLVLVGFIVAKYPDNQTHPDYVYNFTTLPFYNSTEDYEKTGKYYAYPAAIRISPKGYLFMSVPRHVFPEEIGKTIPSTFNIIKNGLLYPWPNAQENDFNTGYLHSVVGFEIDLNGRIWVLNHRPNSRTLYVYSSEGVLIDFLDLTSPTTHKFHTSYLSNIVLDLNSDYVYIADTGIIDPTTYAGNLTDLTKTKSNILVVNLENKFIIKILQKDTSSKPELNYESKSGQNIKNIGIYGLALSCDKKTLYYAPLKSDHLYSVSTGNLANEFAVRTLDDIKKYNKKMASLEFTSSARGIFYYTAVDDNSVFINFYERVLTFNITRKCGHNVTEVPETIEEFPMSLAFNGTTGNLFYLVNKHNIFLNKNLTDKIDETKINFYIMKTYVNDRSYLFSCNNFYYMPNHFWIIILMMSLVLSYSLILMTKELNKEEPEENENLGEELKPVKNI